LGSILESNSEKDGKIGEQIASVTEVKASTSEGFCPGAQMTWKRTLIKKDILSYYTDNDFDLKI